MIDAAVQRDVDGIPKGSHYVLLKRANVQHQLRREAPSGNHRLHVGTRQLAGRVHPDEAGLFSRSPQKLLRVWQLRSLIEVRSHTGGTRGDHHDAVDPAVRRRIADDDGVVVVVRQLVGGRESLPYGSPDRSNELLILRIKPVDEGPELGLRRKFPVIGFHCHRILPVALSGSVLDPPNDPGSASRRTGRVYRNHRDS